MLPVRHGAAFLSAAVNSQHRLFRGKLPCACPQVPEDRAGQAPKNSHLLPMCMAEAVSLDVKQREKVLGKETDCRELDSMREGFNRQLRVQL